jgi:hypothetical protein
MLRVWVLPDVLGEDRIERTFLQAPAPILWTEQVEKTRVGRNPPAWVDAGRTNHDSPGAFSVQLL